MNKFVIATLATLFATSALAATEVPLPPKRPADLSTTTVKPLSLIHISEPRD